MPGIGCLKARTGQGSAGLSLPAWIGTEGYDPDAMTIVDAQEVLRQGIPERRRTPRAVRSDPMTPEGRAEMAAAFANDPAGRCALCVVAARLVVRALDVARRAPSTGHLGRPPGRQGPRHHQESVHHA